MNDYYGTSETRSVTRASKIEALELLGSGELWGRAIG